MTLQTFDVAASSTWQTRPNQPGFDPVASTRTLSNPSRRTDPIWSKGLSVEEIVGRIRHEPDGGTVFAFRADVPENWIVGLTNQVVMNDITNAARRVRRMGQCLALLNSRLIGSITIGWWMDTHNNLVVDMGLAVNSFDDAITVAQVFQQTSIAGLHDAEVRIIDVALHRRSVRASLAH